MAVIRIRSDEMNLVTNAIERKARRTNSRFVVNRDRVEVTEDKEPSSDEAPVYAPLRAQG
jgi:hypothetical protein